MNVGDFVPVNFGGRFFECCRVTGVGKNGVSLQRKTGERFKLALQTEYRGGAMQWGWRYSNPQMTEVFVNA